MEAAHSSETSVFTRPTKRHIPENGILYLRLIKIDKNDHIIEQA
jgi:hypothetical protein